MWSMLVLCLRDRLYYIYQTGRSWGTSEYVEANIESHLRLGFGY